MLAWYDFSMFFAHWLMHTPWFYKHFHRKHHLITHLSPWVSDYGSYLEHTNLTLPPLDTLHRWKHDEGALLHCIFKWITLPEYHDAHHREINDVTAVGKLAVY